MELRDALDSFAVEEYVKKLDCVPLEQLGGKRWSEQACRLIQLSIQAVVEARREGEERVQLCITMDSKGPVLMWELLTCEAFRAEIIPQLFHQSKRRTKQGSVLLTKSSSSSSAQPSSSSAQGPSSSFSSSSSSSASSSSLSSTSYFSASSSISAAVTSNSSLNASSSSCEPSSSFSSSPGSSVSLTSFTDPNVSFSFPSPSSLSSSLSFTSTSSLEKSDLLVSSLSSSSSTSPPKNTGIPGKEAKESREHLSECKSGGEGGEGAGKMATSETSNLFVELKEKEENGAEVEDLLQVLPTSSLPSSIVLQAEAALTGLLECLTFHQDSSVALEGVVLDLVDYCVRQLTNIASNVYIRKGEPIYTPEEAKSEGLNLKKNSANESQLALEEISKESRRVQMVVAARSVGLLQNLCSHLQHLPLCASTRLLQVHDVPILLATLLLETPWVTDYKGKLYRFSEGEWREEGDEDDSPSLSKLDAQMWLTLHTLLLRPETMSSYELNSVRRSQLLKLQKLLTEELLSEMAPLEAMARFLGQLAFMGPQAGRSPPLVTTVAQIGDAPTRQWSSRWPALLQHLAPTLLTPSHSVLRSLAALMAGAWDLDTLEALLPESPTCGLCGQPAGRRCSRCRCQWYCRRECQVKHWKTHKTFCDVIAKEK